MLNSVLLTMSTVLGVQSIGHAGPGSTLGSSISLKNLESQVSEQLNSNPGVQKQMAAIQEGPRKEACSIFDVQVQPTPDGKLVRFIATSECAAKEAEGEFLPHQTLAQSMITYSGVIDASGKVVLDSTPCIENKDDVNHCAY